MTTHNKEGTCHTDTYVRMYTSTCYTVHMYVRKYTRPYTDTTRTDAQTHTRTHTHACTNARTHACMHRRTHARTHACMHECTHTHMHAQTHTRTHTRMHARMHAHMQAHTHARTHGLTHARTHRTGENKQRKLLRTGGGWTTLLYLSLKGRVPHHTTLHVTHSTLTLSTASILDQMKTRMGCSSLFLLCSSLST